MEIMIVDGHTLDEVSKQLSKCRDTLLLGGQPLPQQNNNVQTQINAVINIRYKTSLF